MFKKPAFWIVAVVVLAGLGGLIWRNTDKDKPQAQQITDFAECEAAGYPVGESFPRQCFGPNGQNFVEPVADSNEPNQSQQVKVHFSKNPDSNNDFDFTVAVNRDIQNVSDKIDAGLIELIKGPTAAEADSGLFSPIKLSGESNCDRGNFKYTTASDKFTFSFCKGVTSAGVGDDARIMAVIEATISANAAPSTYDVIILDRNGDCFGDQSGQNLCLN